MADSSINKRPSTYETMNRLFILCLLQWASISISVAAPLLCNYNTPGYVINRFVDNNDGTVFDNYTGLTWLRCVMGTTWNGEYGICARDTDPLEYTWKTALQNIQNFNNQEFSQGRAYDWRMPNIKELTSIINLNCVYPALDTSIFEFEQSTFWSSTPSSTLVPNIQNNSGSTYVYENYIWGVNVLTGKEFREPLSNENAVLLVRGISGK